MKKIHKAWRQHLKEMKSDPDQSRFKVAKKMSDYLFSPLQIIDPRLQMTLKASGNKPSEYMFLHWAIFGSKQEREEGQRLYRPKLGLEFADQKVEMLMLKLSNDEEQILANDIDIIIDIVKAKEHPKDKIQLPVEMTGHPNIQPTLGTTFFNGTASSDWGMGGSILTPTGESYLLHTLKLVKEQLPASNAESISRQEISDLYFRGQRLPIEPSEPTAVKSGRFSKAAFNYQDFLKSIGRGGS